MRQTAMLPDVEPIDPELQEIVTDLEANLYPLLVRYATQHAQRGNRKVLLQMQKNATSAIHRYQPMPDLEYDV